MQQWDRHTAVLCVVCMGEGMSCSVVVVCGEMGAGWIGGESCDGVGMEDGMGIVSTVHTNAQSLHTYTCRYPDLGWGVCARCGETDMRACVRCLCLRCHAGGPVGGGCSGGCFSVSVSRCGCCCGCSVGGSTGNGKGAFLFSLGDRWMGGGGEVTV